MLKLMSIVRLFGLYGFLSGVISALFYLIGEHPDKTLSTSVMVLIGAPLAQAVILMVYGVIGYPVYQFAVRRGLIGRAAMLD